MTRRKLDANAMKSDSGLPGPNQRVGEELPAAAPSSAGRRRERQRWRQGTAGKLVAAAAAQLLRVVGAAVVARPGRLVPSARCSAGDNSPGRPATRASAPWFPVELRFAAAGRLL